MNDFTKFDYSGIKSPCYVVEERLVRNNLRLIQSVAEQSGAKIIMAFKAFALWKLFHITREYIPCSTASSLNEARMAFEKLGSKPHTYAPIYREEEIEQIANLSSHITFNSLRQYEKFGREFKTFEAIGHLAQPEVGAVLVSPDGLEHPISAPGWPSEE